MSLKPQSSKYSRQEEGNDNPMQMHSNKVLQFMEQTWIGKCRKRWLLAILANMGFMISFGIRCNFGAAKTHMYKNYTDPWGKVHVSSFVGFNILSLDSDARIQLDYRRVECDGEFVLLRVLGHSDSRWLSRCKVSTE